MKIRFAVGGVYYGFFERCFRQYCFVQATAEPIPAHIAMLADVLLARLNHHRQLWRES